MGPVPRAYGFIPGKPVGLTTVFIMHLLDLPDEQASTNNVMVELVPPGQGRESRPRELGQRVEVETVNGAGQEIQSPGYKSSQSGIDQR